VTSIDVEGMDNGSTSEDDPGSERGGDEANSEVISSSSEAEESESDSDEKVGVRKPSKRVLENATNEVSALTINDVSEMRGSPSNSNLFFLPTNSHPTKHRRGKAPAQSR